jgi:hypothetical protein
MTDSGREMAARSFSVHARDHTYRSDGRPANCHFQSWGRAMHKAFIVGSSLFAETVERVLSGQAEPKTVMVVGRCPTLEEAMRQIPLDEPDVVIVADVDQPGFTIFGPLLALFPDLPILHADLNTNYVQLITSRSVHADRVDLVNAIVSLPKRRFS